MVYPRKLQPPAAVADHHDSLYRWYREIWGEHVHHGLWEQGDEQPGEAAELLARRVAEALKLEPGQGVCDVGCGYSATARLFTRDFGVRMTGYTLAQAQADYAHLRRTHGRTPSPRSGSLASGVRRQASGVRRQASGVGSRKSEEKASGRAAYVPFFPFHLAMRKLLTPYRFARIKNVQESC